MTQTESLPTTPSSESKRAAEDNSNNNKVLRIYIIRHGQTDFNQRGILQGHYNSQLNAQGHAESTALGVYFKQEGIHADAVWSSDLDRCRATTANILGPNNNTDEGEGRPATTVVFSHHLRERSLGELETMPIAAAKKHAAAAGKTISEYGEPHSAVVDRIHAIWPNFITNALDQNLGTIFFITHGGYIKILAKYLINEWGATVAETIPLDRIRHPANTSFTVLEIPLDADRTDPGQRAVITEFCATPHLTEKHKMKQINFADGQ
jgi:probable phosphoglycerate mutase